jgi:hypothetical protein
MTGVATCHPARSVARTFVKHDRGALTFWNSQNVVCGWLLHCKRFSAILRSCSSVQSCVRPVCVAALSPLALMSSASEVPIGLSALGEGR